MLQPLQNAMLTHKRTLIAAIAITGLLMYAFPYQFMAAEATHRPVSITRTIEIPCLPYCNVQAPQPIDVDAGGRVHIQIGFSLVGR